MEPTNETNEPRVTTGGTGFAPGQSRFDRRYYEAQTDGGGAPPPTVESQGAQASQPQPESPQGAAPQNPSQPKMQTPPDQLARSFTDELRAMQEQRQQQAENPEGQQQQQQQQQSEAPQQPDPRQQMLDRAIEMMRSQHPEEQFAGRDLYDRLTGAQRQQQQPPQQAAPPPPSEPEAPTRTREDVEKSIREEVSQQYLNELRAELESPWQVDPDTLEPLRDEHGNRIPARVNLTSRDRYAINAAVESRMATLDAQFAQYQLDQQRQQAEQQQQRQRQQQQYQQVQQTMRDYIKTNIPEVIQTHEGRRYIPNAIDQEFTRLFFDEANNFQRQMGRAPRNGDEKFILDQARNRLQSLINFGKRPLTNGNQQNGTAPAQQQTQQPPANPQGQQPYQQQAPHDQQPQLPPNRPQGQQAVPAPGGQPAGAFHPPRPGSGENGYHKLLPGERHQMSYSESLRHSGSLSPQ